MSSSYVQIANQQFSTELLASVVVRQRLNAHWTCTVVFRSTPDQRPDLESMQGQPLNIVTYDLLGNRARVVQGVVQRAAVRYEVWGSFGAASKRFAVLEDERRAPLCLLPQTAPGDIAQQLAGNSGLELAGTLQGDANSSRVQWAETDYDFLLQLADDAESWVRPSKLAWRCKAASAWVSLPWREGEYGLLGALARPGRKPVAMPSAEEIDQASKKKITLAPERHTEDYTYWFVRGKHEQQRSLFQAYGGMTSCSPHRMRLAKSSSRKCPNTSWIIPPW